MILWKATCDWVQHQRSWRVLAAFTSLHLLAIGLFTHGFLLTRTELPFSSTCTESPYTNNTQHADSCKQEVESTSSPYQAAGPIRGKLPGCWAPGHFNKTLWIIVDALRFDFVADEPPISSSSGVRDQLRNDQVEGYSKTSTTALQIPQSHVQQMPHLLSLARELGGASQLVRFVADPPTTTMQRLRGILTGGLPTFIDVGSSFSAAAIAEDNLIDQLAAAGRRLAFVGDDTWMQLFPTQFASSLPYPSLNVHDLDTVDNGVWEALGPAVQRGDEWDVMVAHGLGIDHAGHTYNVGSPQMLAKVQETDQRIKEVVDALLALGQPGGVHERTLLIIFGDHGQTMGGDHGGGSSEEVDSALVAVDIGALHTLRAERASHGAVENSGAGNGVKNGDGNGVPNGKGGTIDEEFIVSFPVMAQVDFAPTVAILMGVPIPYGSIGRVSPELWNLTGDSKGYCDVLLANAWQVHRYLNAYAASDMASLPASDLRRSNALYESAMAAVPSVEKISRLSEYLESAASLARTQWTQFDGISIVAGISVFLTSIIFQLVVMAALYHNQATRAHIRHPSAALSDRTVDPLLQNARSVDGLMLAVVSAPLLHSAALFSDSFILAEGQMLGYGLASLTVILTLSVCSEVPFATDPSSRLQDLGYRDAPPLLHSSVDGIPSSAENPMPGGNKRYAEDGGVAEGGVRVRCIGALVLFIGWALGAYGLIKRSSHDAMWRATVQPSPTQQDLIHSAETPLVVPEAASVGFLLSPELLGSFLDAAAGFAASVAASVAIYGPLVLLPWVLLRARKCLLCINGEGSTQLLLSCLLYFSNACVALYWLSLSSFISPASSATLGSALTELSRLLSSSAHRLLTCCHPQTYWGKLVSYISTMVSTMVSNMVSTVQLALVNSPMLQGLMYGPAASSFTAGLCQTVRHVSAIRLGLLLPRCSYLAATAAILYSIIHLRCSTCSTAAEGGDDNEDNTATVASAAAIGLLAALLPPLHLVMGPQWALTLVLAITQGACLLALLQYRMESGTGDGSVPEIGAVLWSTGGSYLFFCTGHFCEFAGLQYTAGFAGVEDFAFYQSGALLALNTFGPHLLACITLPLLCLSYGQIACLLGRSTCTQSRLTAAQHERIEDDAFAELKAGETTSGKTDGAEQTGHSHSPKEIKRIPPLECSGGLGALTSARGRICFSKKLLRAALTLMTCHSLTAFAATVSAAIQRRHLMVWALFAPKFLFEAVTLMICDAVLVLLVVIVQ